MRIPLITFLVLLSSCATKTDLTDTTSEGFTADISALQEYFHIPGMAVLVKQGDQIRYENYLGYADVENQRPVDSTTIFPIASITKTFATVLLLQQVEAGTVDLETPINAYLRQPVLADSVKIKHILSHSSEGVPGSFFNYSSRFGMLTPVIEKSGEQAIAAQLQSRIIDPLALGNTVPLVSEAVLESKMGQMARPYSFYGTTEPGHYDTGLSASSGLASTVRDLAEFDNALNANRLLSQELQDQMFTPFNHQQDPAYPYGYGIFTQTFLGKKIKWVYGQEDCFSSLLVKVPGDDLTLILLANNNLMSDPARLINGDITYSLFAMSFLKHFVFDLPVQRDFSAFQSPQALNGELIEDHPEVAAFYRQEQLAHALSASFIGYVDSAALARSKQLTEAALRTYPDFESYGNQTLLRLLMVLSTNGDDRGFDQPLTEIGEALLAKNRYDPYTNIYLAYYHQNLGQPEQAYGYFNNIATAPNLHPFWYSIEAYDFLGDYHKAANPELAKTYFQKIIDIGWNMGGKLDKAKKEVGE